MQDVNQSKENQTVNHFGLVRESEMVQILQITRQALWQHRRKGNIPYLKLGKQIFYDVEEVKKSLTVESKRYD